MGKWMALNLAEHLSEKGGQPLRVWNRSASKSRDVEAESKGKAVAVASLEEIATSCVCGIGLRTL